MEMHVGMKDPVERLLALNKETLRIKDSPIVSDAFLPTLVGQDYSW